MERWVLPRVRGKIFRSENFSPVFIAFASVVLRVRAHLVRRMVIRRWLFWRIIRARLSGACHDRCLRVQRLRRRVSAQWWLHHQRGTTGQWPEVQPHISGAYAHAPFALFDEAGLIDGEHRVLLAQEAGQKRRTPAGLGGLAPGSGPACQVAFKLVGDQFDGGAGSSTRCQGARRSSTERSLAYVAPTTSSRRCFWAACSLPCWRHPPELEVERNGSLPTARGSVRACVQQRPMARVAVTRASFRDRLKITGEV